MYVILVYDVNEKRVAKVLKLAREYLHWVQNSVLEGELTVASYKIFKDKIKKKINPKEDAVTFYTFSREEITQKDQLGIEKGGPKLLI